MLDLPHQSIPSVHRSFPYPWAAVPPLVSAPIHPLNRALVVRFRSINTSISSRNQLLAVTHVPSRLQLLSEIGPVPTHTHILQLGRLRDSWDAMLYVGIVGAARAA